MSQGGPLQLGDGILSSLDIVKSRYLLLHNFVKSGSGLTPTQFHSGSGNLANDLKMMIVRMLVMLVLEMMLVLVGCVACYDGSDGATGEQESWASICHKLDNGDDVGEIVDAGTYDDDDDAVGHEVDDGATGEQQPWSMVGFGLLLASAHGHPVRQGVLKCVSGKTFGYFEQKLPPQ